MPNEKAVVAQQGQYNPNSALAAVRLDAQRRKNGGKRTKGAVRAIDYSIVLAYVQNAISANPSYADDLAKVLDSEDASKDVLKNIIYNVLQQYPGGLEREIITTYTDRIMEDMTGLSFITKYLDDPEVEEINIFGPGPGQTEIVFSGKGSVILEHGFQGADDALNIVKRMIRQGGAHLDASQPRVDSYMGGGTRVSAMCAPIVREDRGVVASIRKQTQAKITKGDLVDALTATKDELALIELCMRNKVSGAIVGATGSGKTTLLNYLLTDYVESTQKQARVYIIEESREMQLPEDAKVVYTAVCGDGRDDGSLQVTAPDLLKSALRFHPDFICCAEMRGEEAMNAMNAAQTGHIVWSTFHADNCEEAYPRLLSMCLMSGTKLSEDLLLRNLVQAFPIIISAKQLRDRTRKITGIFEAERVEHGQVFGHYIYQAQISSYEYADDGSVKAIRGRHARVGNLSDKLAQRIYENCGLLDQVKKFAREGWEPEGLRTDGAAFISAENF